ncbi:acetylornithine deacetylase [Roseibium denhamense]|uniref:acetylornithine deacetylase n=1 Tax=Roseibium denhamense TaxID=76305 RepID=UPI0018AD165B|nr:acetylornithine deacetylase [Roseibium denhamense]
MADASKETLEILSRLVGFDTVSDRSNLGLVGYVEDYLRDLDIPFETIPTEDGTKASILARIGPQRPGGVILSAHSDVVPVEGQDWSSNPFELRIENGRAYGRGTCDMKGFFASVLAAAPKFKAEHLETPIYFAFSYDEEVGCAGVAPLIQRIREICDGPRACIVGEPTGMEPVTAHTGKQIFQCDFFGTPMHSSLAPRGRNAITAAAEVLNELNRFVAELSCFKTSDTRFPITHPTINVGTIEGGKATNIVAEYCKFVVEYRHPPGTPENALRDELSTIFAAIPDQMGRFRETASYPSFLLPNGSRALDLVQQEGEPRQTHAVNYGTEAGLFAEAGIDTVVLGPGDIQQAHQPDEFIELSELASCDAFLQELCAELSKGTLACQLPA